MQALLRFRGAAGYDLKLLLMEDTKFTAQIIGEGAETGELDVQSIESSVYQGSIEPARNAHAKVSRESSAPAGTESLAEMSLA